MPSDEKLKQPLRNRITVVETLYHQPIDGDATSFVSQYWRFLRTSEQVWNRVALATEDWQPLDCGWVDKAGLLVIRNDEGRFLQTIPTEYERGELCKKIIEVCYEGSHVGDEWLIHPGESMRALPANVRDLRIRSRYGKARYTICLIPE